MSKEENRKQLPKIARFIDEVKEFFPEVKPTFVSENGKILGKESDLEIGYWKDGICHRREK